MTAPAAADRAVLDILVDLLRLERDRPPEFIDGGVSARAWAQRVRELEEQLRERAPDVWARLAAASSAPRTRA